MCTAYEIDGADYDVDFLVADAFEAAMAEEGMYRIIRPTLMAPVILPDRTFRIMSWGFRYTPRGQKKPRTVVNSREDQLKIGLWRDKFKSNRCLIPASAFFEWVQADDGKMMPLRFTRPGKKAILIAGVWGEEEGRGECFSMITTEPTVAIGAVHDRMPAVLAEDQLRPYLEGELNEFGPSRVALDWVPTENFLKKPKPPVRPQKSRPLPVQLDLFAGMTTQVADEDRYEDVVVPMERTGPELCIEGDWFVIPNPEDFGAGRFRELQGPDGRTWFFRLLSRAENLGGSKVWQRVDEITYRDDREKEIWR